MVTTSTKELAITLTEAELEIVGAILNTVENLATDLAQTLENTEKRLIAATKTAVADELQAAEAALKPFVQPIIAYAKSVKAISGDSTSSALADVQAAVASIVAAVTALLAAISVTL